MVCRDLGHGFKAVPTDAVTKNGMYLSRLNTATEPYTGRWHLLAPNGYIIDSENGGPFTYPTIEEAQEDVDRLVRAEEYSTCGGNVVTRAAPSPERIIPLTDEEWQGVQAALGKRIEALEAWPAEHGYSKVSENNQQVIDWTRLLFKKIHDGLHQH